MGPALDNLVDHGARTVCQRLHQLTVRKQLVILVQLAQRGAPLYDITQRAYLLIGRFLLVEIPDQRDADAVLVIVRRVYAGLVPAATLEDHSVAADQKVIANNAFAR